MRCQTIPFRRLPHQSKLFLQYIEDFSRVSSLYAHPPKLSAVLRAARKLKFPAERRSAVTAVLREQNAALGAGTATLRNLDRLESGAVAIVTGQQVGLFSGPPFAIYKALTAVTIAEEVSRAGIQAVPVFWMATEDHDLDEVRSSTWFDQGKLARFELPGATSGAQPVGRILLGTDIDAMVAAASEKLTGRDAERFQVALRECYRADETYGSAFGKLFMQLFADEGLILLDPLDPRLHRIAAPIYRQAAQESGVLNKGLLERGRELERKGFAAQVKVTSRSTLLLSMAGGIREPIAQKENGFQAGETTLSTEALLRIAESSPENLSPNALLRPVVQDFLLPTAACIVGPAEIAYFAQSEVVYRRLLGRMPVVLPRADFTIVDSTAARLLVKYGMSVEQIWEGRQESRKRMEQNFLPAGLTKRFERSTKEMEKAIERLRGPLLKLDASLAGAMDHARKSVRYHVEELGRKAGKARDLREGVLSTHEEYLHSLLYPHKMTQSRLLCFLPFVARAGTEVFAELKRLSQSKRLSQHQILFLD